MSRREELPEGCVIVDAVPAPRIEGEINPSRALDILSDMEAADPTVEELRLMLGYIEKLDDTWVGARAISTILVKGTEALETYEEKEELVNCPEFRGLSARYRNSLEGMKREHL